jgi:tRNA-specific 2-thiouridylase
MKKSNRVLIAMSGGVDSSVAAALLKRQGYEVIGATMKLWNDPQTEAASGAEGAERSCCTLSAVEDARRVAQMLEIPHYVFNFRAAFEQEVIEYFTTEYLAGRTPNPCIACNRHIKFGTLMHRAKELGAEYVATGHYAQIDINPQTQTFCLRKGLDSKKDQSYVLYHLNQELLSHFLLPLGGLTKIETRAIAAEFGFSVANKPESQEICFIPNNDYRKFIADRAPGSIVPGNFVSPDGRILGTHKGFACYTVGQRKGLGIALGQPMFVSAVNPISNEVTLGLEADIFTDSLIASDFIWSSGNPPVTPFSAAAKIRYNAAESPAYILPLPDQRVEVRFDKKQRAITPGQSVVLYDGDCVLGGGIIE